MSVAQFDALLAILVSHIKKATNFCELSLQGSLRCVVLRDKWMNLTIAIVDFVVLLYGGSELSTGGSGCVKCRKYIPIQVVLWRMRFLEAVCKCDWHNVRSYLFLNRFCAMDFTLKTKWCWNNFHSEVTRTFQNERQVTLNLQVERLK